MASIAERQAVAIISAVHGAVNVCRNEDRFSVVKLKEELNDLATYLQILRNGWSKNYTEKDIAWTVKAMDKWANTLYDLNIPPEIQTPVLIKFSIMAMEDLLCKLNNKIRKIHVEVSLDRLKDFGAFVDPEGRGFMSFEAADVLLDAFYKEIRFVR